MPTDKPHLVPKTVSLPKAVRGDWPIGHQVVAPAGEYEAYCNPYGAVNVKTPSGALLGIKPSEFDVIEWKENPYAD